MKSAVISKEFAVGLGNDLENKTKQTPENPTNP
jgi:hypothetical protein